MIFDATLHKDKPDTGMVQIDHVNGAMLEARDWQRVSGSNLVYFDAETSTDEQAISAVKDFREVFPALRCGFYDVFPRKDYWRAIQGQDSEEYKQWGIENDDRFVAAQSVDVVFPSLYTFYDDVENWTRFATENIFQARKYNREVIPFLWYQYHPSTRYPEYIGDEYFNMQLKFCLSQCDSVAIWGGWDLSEPSTGREVWDENSAWWQVVKNYL